MAVGEPKGGTQQSLPQDKIHPQPPPRKDLLNQPHCIQRQSLRVQVSCLTDSVIRKPCQAVSGCSRKPRYLGRVSSRAGIGKKKAQRKLAFLECCHWHLVVSTREDAATFRCLCSIHENKPRVFSLLL